MIREVARARGVSPLSCVGIAPRQAGVPGVADRKQTARDHAEHQHLRLSMMAMRAATLCLRIITIIAILLCSRRCIVCIDAISLSRYLL